MATTNEILLEILKKQFRGQLQHLGSPISTTNAIPVQITDTPITITGPVTISNEVEIKNDIGNPIPVVGPITDTQLRATALNTNALTNTQLRATAVPVSGPLTDAQLRATAVPVSGPLTDTQLRAVSVNINPVVSKGSGTVDANTQRVTLATDSPTVSTLSSIDGKTPALINGAVPHTPRPNNTGSNGTTPYKLISLDSTNSNVIKNSGGNLYSIVAIGLTSTVRFLKFYNKASAPIVGTDIPVMTIPIPANTYGAGISIPFSMGVNFPIGIAIAITANSGDTDTTIIGANDVLINLTYA